MTYTLPVGLRDREWAEYLPKELKQTVRSTVGSGAFWNPSGTQKIVITDLIVSAGSSATENNVTLAVNGSTLTSLFLAPNGTFFSNFETPIGGYTGSLFLQTSVAGSVSVTAIGYEV